MKNFGIILVVFLVVLAFVFMPGNPVPDEYTIQEYTVQTGDTLWSIGRNTIEPGENIQAWLHETRKLNNIDPDLKPGQKIFLPVY